MFSVMARQTWAEKSDGSVPAGVDGLRHAVGKLARDRQHLLPGKLTAFWRSPENDADR